MCVSASAVTLTGVLFVGFVSHEIHEKAQSARTASVIRFITFGPSIVLLITLVAQAKKESASVQMYYNGAERLLQETTSDLQRS